MEPLGRRGPTVAGRHGARVKRVVMVGVSVSDREQSLGLAAHLAVDGGVVASIARETTNTRATAALRRRFDALRATPLRAHSSPTDNAALSHVELSSYPLRVDIVLNPVSLHDRYVKARGSSMRRLSCYFVVGKKQKLIINFQVSQRLFFKTQVEHGRFTSLEKIMSNLHNKKT